LLIEGGKIMAKQMLKSEKIKVKALIDCTGDGYTNFNKDEERELPKDIAEILINFGYAEEIK